MAKNYMLRVHFKNGSSRIVPLEFDSMKKARKYAIDNMEAMPNISSFQMSNPNYADVWQVSSKIYRTDDGKFYWSALKPYAGWQKGSGHYINKDGSLSKKAYDYYAKDW